MSEHLVEVANLSLTVGEQGREIVSDASFTIRPGEMVGIVGESGSGKTQVARAIIGLTPPPLVRSQGKIMFEGVDVTTATSAELRALRGARIGMVFQEPMTSLNPSMKIGRQLDEGLALHRRSMSARQRRERIVAMLERVGITDTAHAIDAWPHEFSGGMRQRIMLAATMLLEPALLIADEPTTALDAVVQRDVLELMAALIKEHNTAVLMISHDLPMVARYTERIIVMQHGRIVEEGLTQDLLAQPAHPYTRKLLAAIPFRTEARSLPEREPIVQVDNLVIEYPGKSGLFARGQAKRALKGISLSVRPGEVLAVVGGSGSGKTTLGRAIAGLLKPTSGDIRFAGQSIDRSSQSWRDYRLNCQMVFQDPYSSLDPRMTVGQLVGEGLRHVKTLSSAQRRQRVAEVLDEVGLGDGYADRFPHEMSGGQRQRVAIARALAVEPQVMLLDEPLSALDLKLRQHMRAELRAIQKRTGVTFIYITHDQGEALAMSDRVGVMSQGRLQQVADPREIYNNPVNGFVAGFVGEMNRLTGEIGPVADGIARYDTPHGAFRARLSPGAQGVPSKLYIRPEHMTIATDGQGENVVPVTIGDIAFEGNFITVSARSDDGLDLTAEVRNDGVTRLPEPGSRAFMRFDPARAVILPDESKA